MKFKLPEIIKPLNYMKDLLSMGCIFKSEIPNHLKKKTFEQCVLPVMTYGTETLFLTQGTAIKLRVAQRKMETGLEMSK